ncbi:MAG TPA: metalloregulator ArsR/SmtB family transcription factor [Streptosporangiaceae bacterium]|nr:metalloregulator ArsR/SmtB family transcription factor [Streptosporangiaceae bacterium]
MNRELGRVSEAEPLATAPGTEHSPYARFFRILGDPTRLAIVQLLLTRPYSVTELVQELGVSQSRVSNHLACLRWCHVAVAERRGRRVVYTITDSRLRRLLDLASELVPDDPEPSEDYRRIGPDWI